GAASGGAASGGARRGMGVDPVAGAMACSSPRKAGGGWEGGRPRPGPAPRATEGAGPGGSFPRGPKSPRPTPRGRPPRASAWASATPPPPRPCAAGEGGSGPGWELSALAEEPEADAAVTATPGVVLAILTADCLPVVFAARDGSELAAAHAGWPGLSAGMLEATLAAMRTPPGDRVAWIRPCAEPPRSELGRNVVAASPGPDPGAEAAFVPTREGNGQAGLPALARRGLVAAGMRATDIHGGDLCTISDPARFFSHRRDGRSGRLATIAWLEPGARGREEWRFHPKPGSTQEGSGPEVGGVTGSRRRRRVPASGPRARRDRRRNGGGAQPCTAQNV